MPEHIPSGLHIASFRRLNSFTEAAFEPLIGPTKFSEFNAGQSDHWAGLYTFAPSRTNDTARLMAWVCKLKTSGEFYAYYPDRRVPAGGAVSGMTYAGRTGDLVGFGNGPTNSTPLVAGDYIQIGSITGSPIQRPQFFTLLEDLETDGSGDGAARVWPTPRSGLTVGMSIVTENPVMVARITSPVPQETDASRLTQITISWEQV
jgi:hypothetical protein